MARPTMTRLSAVTATVADAIATATLTVETEGEGLSRSRVTRRVSLRMPAPARGLLFLFIRHTSASLTVQENADPDVRTDLVTALRRLAPSDAPWVHDVEGPDDMPAHVKTMLTGVSLHVPVIAGALALGTWQGIYVAEHRVRPHRREVLMRFIGTCA